MSDIDTKSKYGMVHDPKSKSESKRICIQSKCAIAEYLRHQLTQREEELSQVKQERDEAIEAAHMAGQANAGVDPSYSEAQNYRIKIAKENSEPVSEGEDK